MGLGLLLNISSTGMRAAGSGAWAGLLTPTSGWTEQRSDAAIYTQTLRS